MLELSSLAAGRVFLLGHGIQALLSPVRIRLVAPHTDGQSPLALLSATRPFYAPWPRQSGEGHTVSSDMPAAPPGFTVSGPHLSGSGVERASPHFCGPPNASRGHSHRYGPPLARTHHVVESRWWSGRGDRSVGPVGLREQVPVVLGSVGRKVRTGQGTVVANGNPARAEGKCHRKDTALDMPRLASRDRPRSGLRRSLMRHDKGKGEKVR